MSRTRFDFFDKHILSLGENLEELMEEKEVTPNELAKKAGFSISIMYRYLNGESIPSLPCLIKLCYILDVTPDLLLGYLDE